MEQRNIFHGYAFYSYSQRCRKVQCTYCVSGVNWSPIVTQISLQHPFHPLERQMEFWAAPLLPPGLAMCCKCCSEWWVTNFYTADAVQMATPAWSSKKVENLLHNNCHLPLKATIWGILLLQVNERATGQTLLAHKQEHSLIGKLKQQAVGNPRNQDWWLKWAPSLSLSHWLVLASRWASS